MSIKKSLRILLVITSMLPAFIILVLTQGFLNNRLMTIQTQNLQGVAETNRNVLKAMIDTQSAEVSLLSIQNEFRHCINTGNSNQNIYTSICDNLLKERKNIYKSCEMISLYNADGRIVDSSNPAYIGLENESKPTLTYLDASKKIAVGVGGIKQLKQGGKTIHTIEIGCPIFMDRTKQNKIIGYIVSTLRITYFEDILGSIRVGKTGYCILLDQDGTILYHKDSSYIGKNINSKQISNLIKNYKNNKTHISGILEPNNHISDKNFGYCIIPELNWVLLVTQDFTELRSPIIAMLILMMILYTIILIIIIISSNNLARRYSTPIIALRDAMRTASEGNLSVQSNIKSNNELGELSESFNKMMHIINANYKDLASMHEKLIYNEEQLRSNYDHIEFLAYHDTLTNLPNKLAFLDYMNSTLASSYLENNMHAVYFVDLDNFKTVNDTLGHEYGDTLLMKTAQILSTILDGNGMLARAGGDEFLIFKENILSKEDAENFASRIINSFRNPMVLNGEVVYVSMSIGIAVYPENGTVTKNLIKNADIAMYKSKDTGKNKYTIFNRKMEEELHRNTIIIEILRNAIDNHEIYIKYQPLIEVKSNHIIGFEALMRMKSERLGNLKPDEFIPIAEESGLINELGSWLLREACRFNKELLDQGFTPRLVSVNISSIQINHPGFIGMLSDILEETGLPPQYLELEITESTLVSSILDTTQLLSSLQELGVKISLDDFGTGYSSLNYLTKMPINTLKIDKSFIDNICNNNKDAYIADAIINLAHSLNIKVVAEGVEYEEQLSLLRAKKCDIIQGYIFSSPLHPSALIDCIKESRCI